MRGPIARISAAGALIALEWIGISALFQASLGGLRIAWVAVPFCSVFLALGHKRFRAAIPSVGAELESAPLDWRFVGAHFAALASFLILYTRLAAQANPDTLLIVPLYACALLSIAFLLLAFVPARVCAVFLRQGGSAWIYAAAGGLVASQLVFFLMATWRVRRPSSLAVMFENFTFQSVRATLELFVSGVTTNPRLLVLATPRFSVNIGGACSGIEGLGLMLVFTTLWLWFFRKESRFPQALLLIPAALVLSWLANIVRITALILIGHFGARSIAVGGFHSLAGWISFNVIAVAFVFVAARVPWLSRAPEAHASVLDDNPTATYLLPFVAILLASLASRAVTSDFEWLYPLRFVAAAVALWMLRAGYRGMNWRFGWTSAFAGVAAFAIWMLSDAWIGGNDSVLGSALGSLPSVTRNNWLLFRIAAATITVPIAEELAFRGYLARRIVASDFESVRFVALPVVGVLASSILFGLMHGSQWIVATVVGVMYAAVLRRSGRIGDAVFAHATTNALLAIWVLSRGAWHLW